MGEGENNGGIDSKGGQQLVFVTVLNIDGTPMDGAVIRNALDFKFENTFDELVTGNKGPGRTEIKVEWDPYKMYVARTPDGPVTSQISNQMSNTHPHIPDVVGKLGSEDKPYAVCPTPEIKCTPPFYSVHFSYEITFQRMR